MTEEHDLIRDSARNYLRDNYDFAARQALADSGTAIDTAHWQAFADMGWTALTLPEELGGLDLGMTAAASLAELWGYYLVREPLLESAVLAGSVVASAGSALGEQLAAGIIEGSVQASLPLAGSPTLTVGEDSHGKTVTGQLRFVPSGGSATHLLAEARLADRPCWVAIELSAPGIERHSYMGHDGRVGAHITVNTSLADTAILSSGPAAVRARDNLLDVALLLAANEGVGLMQGALDLTVDYTKQREQFGQPLAGFQALQHRMSDMLIQTELARSLAQAACTAFDSGVSDAKRLILAAKAKVDAAARTVTQEAIQLHGGIATTNEYQVGHFFKRATLLESWPLHRDTVIEHLIALRPTDQN